MARNGKPLTSISSFEKKQEVDKPNSNTEQLNVTVKSKSKTDNDFIQQFKEKAQKPTIEETHTRQTYLIKNEILTRLNKLAKGEKRGFKTDLVNYAIEKVIDEIENKN